MFLVQAMILKTYSWAKFQNKISYDSVNLGSLWTEQ